MSGMSTKWNHHYIDTGDITLHYVRHGSGPPLVLIHGWPEFWYTWYQNIPALAEHFDVIAIDQRGFGESEKPDVPPHEGYKVEHRVADLVGLLDELEVAKVGIVAHDVGAHVAQGFARQHAEYLRGLFLFNPPYPGIGKRWADHPDEIWYQWFNQQPWAADLVGENRRTCEIYIGHWLRSLSADKEVFEKDMETWVDNFMKPGNLQGGFNWYSAIDDERRDLISNGAPDLPQIEAPTRVLWGTEDGILRSEWADRLDEYFAHCDCTLVEDVGHFVHYEKPEMVNQEITDFFSEVFD